MFEELAGKVSSLFGGEALDWAATGEVSGQHRGDVVVDKLCVQFLTSAGLSVYSEESGLTSARGNDSMVVVLDPVDGSTNASRGLPLFVLSCALIEDGTLLAGYVHELTNQACYWAIRGQGAHFPSSPRQASRVSKELSRSVVAVNGYPKAHLGWGQFRALGSAALELSMVASGQLDAYVDCSRLGLAPWDYLGALAILREAGCAADSLGSDPKPESEIFGPRRHIVAASSDTLLEELRGAWARSL